MPAESPAELSIDECAAWVDAGDGWVGADPGAWLDQLLEPTVEQLWEATHAANFDDAADAQSDCGSRGDLASAHAQACAALAPPGPIPVELASWVRAEWWDAPIREQVRALMVMAPGPGLVAALAELGAQTVCPADHRHPDPAVEAADPIPAPGSAPGYPCACQLVTTAAWQAVDSWVQTRSAVALVDAAGAQPVVASPAGFARAQTTDPARVELAPMLHVATTSVPARLCLARDLHAHPTLAAAAADGLLFTPAWRAVLQETANLPAESRARVIDHVVDVVQTRHRGGRRPWTPGEVRRAVKRAIHSLAADDVDQAREQAYEGRRVAISPDGDGMAWISACIRDVDAHRVYSRLTATAAARKADSPDDPRTMDQHRADTLIALLLAHPTPHPADPEPSSVSAPDSDSAPSRGSAPDTVTAPGDPRPEICVIATLDTLLGLTNAPAEVPGIGPIPADIARDLAGDGRWRLWITDPATGQVAITGSRTYTPSASLARLIRAREPRCRMPGCPRHAMHCDLDHTTAYPQGPTTADNLGPLCRTHHNLKTHHHYQLTTTAQPGWKWSFPSGLTHTDRPDPPLPIRHLSGPE